MFRGIQKVAQLMSRTGLVNNPQRSISKFRDVIGSLKNEWDHGIQPGGGLHNPHTMEMTETELFDEDAHELQAMITSNTYDLEIMMGDTNPQRNFGTVDNPVIMFSANVGWRYVMCTGMNDEEEGQSHIGVWFILREGPIHRCQNCGQCFKLINLKDEISEENDYYMDHYMPILEEEMGDRDDMITRFSFHKFAEPYPSLIPMQNTNLAYILVNPDDHDRILTDPAYRLQKLKEGHKNLNSFHQAMIEIEDKLLWQRGGYYPPVDYTKGDYEDLITAELAIRKLDRIFAKVQQFHKRSILEPSNHERREARMRERAEARAKNFVQYVNTNETEMMYKDYYESDYDSEEELIAQQEDYEELYASGIFDFKNYNFHDEGTDGTLPVAEGAFEKKMFKFKHRKWNEDPSNHFIRENRMIQRFIERMKTRDPTLEYDIGELSENSYEYATKTLNYQEYVADEAILQYKDYYESDTEDIRDFDHITPEEKAKFAEVFKDYSKPLGDLKTIISIPMRQYDHSKSILTNLSEQFKDLRTRVKPEINHKTNKIASHKLGLGKAKHFKIASGTYKFEEIKGLEDVFSDHIKELKEYADSPKFTPK